MCGIAGIINPADPSLERSIKSMTDAISHRGPDGDGFYLEKENGLALGHRRLSIIDLSEGGNQPMFSKDGRFAIVYNGEIYNYIEIRERLLKAGVTFRSSCDTEVLLELYIRERQNCLYELDGMFAFVIWDKVEKTLFFARDRFGEKPFYYAYAPGRHFLFASEIKALQKLEGLNDVNEKQLYNYLAYGNVYNPADPEQTFFEKIKKLPAAHYGFISSIDLTIKVERFWKLEVKETDNCSIEDATENFRSMLSTSVRRRLRSDVPVGSSLSGGLDSSIIVAIINELNNDNLIRQNTFSAKFPGFEKDESYFIDKVVAAKNVAPHFTCPDESSFLKQFEALCYHQDEPFGSASIFAQWEVMRLAKEANVTVLLDGQGADEILGGYHDYYRAYFQELFLKDRSAYKEQWSKYVSVQQKPFSRDFKFYGSIYLGNFKEHFGWLKEALNNRFSEKIEKGFYRRNKKHSTGGIISSAPTLNKTLLQSIDNGSLELLLRYADRNSMAHSREVRLPFLSHKLVEFLFTLPPSYKIRDGWTKYIARAAFANILPEEIVWRKDKIGYEPPQKKWMANKEVGETIQEMKRVLVKKNILNKEVLNEPVQGSGANDRGNNSWNYLMAGKLFEKK